MLQQVIENAKNAKGTTESVVALVSGLAAEIETRLRNPEDLHRLVEELRSQERAIADAVES